VSGKWYFMKADEELGPYSWQEMQSFAEAGIIKPENMVMAEDMEEWVEANQVEGLLPKVGLAVPVETISSPVAVMVRRSPLPVILLVLALLLLGVGATAYVYNLWSGRAEEAGFEEVADDRLVSEEGAYASPLGSPTGPPLYSLGPGKVPDGFSRTTPNDPVTGDSSPSKDSSAPQHSVFNVMIGQPSPAALHTGTPVGYSFDYTTNHSGNVYITGVPLRDGSPLRDVTVNPRVDSPTGRGSGGGFFTVNSPQVVNQFRVRMHASGTDTILHERFFNVNYTYTTAPDPLEPEPGPAAPGLAPPSAAFIYSPLSPKTGDRVTFDASGSSSPNGSIEKYTWQIGTSDRFSTLQFSFTHTFNTPGQYPVRLTVEDSEGLTNSVERIVTVTAAESISACFVIYPGSATMPYHFDATCSQIPAGVNVLYKWDLRKDDLSAVRSTSFIDASIFTVPIERRGNYVMTLTIRDDSGNIAIAEQDFTAD
jgi:PKD repeat protein